MNTPWGISDSKTTLTRGISWVGTPSHGGFMVTKTVASKLLSCAAIKRGREFGSYLAFEEDCDFAIVMLELPAELLAKLDGIPSREKLIESLSRWHADYLMERGIEPSPDGYAYFKKNREEDALRTAKGPLVVAAWGSWAPGVPKEHVRVELADGRKFIIPSLQYQSLPNTQIPTIDKFPNAVEELAVRS